MNIKKQAQRDAHELARATMFFGEGAGNRRKLIQATVQQKLDRDPNGYGVAFYNAIDREDMAEHAEAARKERKRIDRKDSLQKNTRAVLSGNRQHISSNVVLLVAAGVALHKTGLDKVIVEKTRTGYYFTKQVITRAKKDWKDRKNGHNVRPVN